MKITAFQQPKEEVPSSKPVPGPSCKGAIAARIAALGSKVELRGMPMPSEVSQTPPSTASDVDEELFSLSPRARANSQREESVSDSIQETTKPIEFPTRQRRAATVRRPTIMALLVDDPVHDPGVSSIS
jgi:hypothetical protein